MHVGLACLVSSAVPSVTVPPTCIARPHHEPTRHRLDRRCAHRVDPSRRSASQHLSRGDRAHAQSSHRAVSAVADDVCGRASPPCRRRSRAGDRSSPARGRRPLPPRARTPVRVIDASSSLLTRAVSAPMCDRSWNTCRARVSTPSSSWVAERPRTWRRRACSPSLPAGASARLAWEQTSLVTALRRAAPEEPCCTVPTTRCLGVRRAWPGS